MQKESEVFKTVLTQQKKEDDGNTRLEFGEGTCNDERRRRAKFKGRFIHAKEGDDFNAR